MDDQTLRDQPTYGLIGACAYLHVSETSLRELIESGKLPASKPSREYVIRKAVLDEYLAKLEREQTEERKRAFEEGRKPRIVTDVGDVRRTRKRQPLPELPDLPQAA